MGKREHTTIEGKLGNEFYIQDPTDGGYTAVFSEFPELVSEGKTIEEAQENLWNTLFDTLTYLLKRK